jgi:hypothetical protein
MKRMRDCGGRRCASWTSSILALETSGQGGVQGRQSIGRLVGCGLQRDQAVVSLAKDNVQELSERRIQLKREMEQPNDEQIDNAKRELMNVNWELLHLQVELVDARLDELQTKAERETTKQRRDQADRIARLKQTQCEAVLPRQEQAKMAMIRREEVASADELERLGGAFGLAGEQIEAVASSGGGEEQ